MSQLEAHEALGSPQGTQLLCGPPTGPHQLLQQQCILAHALDGLQQVGGQVHLVPQRLLLVLPGSGETIRRLQGTPSIPTSPYRLRLTYLEEGVTIAGHQGIRARFILAVESIHPKLHPLQRHMAQLGCQRASSQSLPPPPRARPLSA